MAENSKLYISISDDRGNGNRNTPTASSSSANKNGKKEKENENLLGRYVEHELFHLVKKNTMQAVNYSLANIGNFTGDYISQRRVNELKQAVTGFTSIGMSTLAGAQVGGIVGAVVGFAAGTASLVVDTVYDNITNKAEYAKQNYNIAQLKDRVGLNSIYDGSRGTEN